MNFFMIILLTTIAAVLGFYIAYIRTVKRRNEEIVEY